MKKHNSTPIALPEPCAKTLRLMWTHIKIQPKGCWLWTGRIRHTGYPDSICVFGAPKKGPFYRPQRLMFHWFKYAIPPVFTVDHLCKNRACVNPDHMEAVSHGENVTRALKRKYCQRGHLMAGDNLYHYKSNGKSVRRCKPCMKITQRAQKGKKLNRKS